MKVRERLRREDRAMHDGRRPWTSERPPGLGTTKLMLRMDLPWSVCFRCCHPINRGFSITYSFLQYYVRPWWTSLSSLSSGKEACQVSASSSSIRRRVSPHYRSRNIMSSWAGSSCASHDLPHHPITFVSWRAVLILIWPCIQIQSSYGYVVFPWIWMEFPSAAATGDDTLAIESLILPPDHFGFELLHAWS